MDQRGTADLAQFPQPPSNSGPQEMERIAGSVRGHLLLCQAPPPRHLPVTPTLRLLDKPQYIQATLP